jgi:hypothetical protein
MTLSGHHKAESNKERVGLADISESCRRQLSFSMSLYPQRSTVVLVKLREWAEQAAKIIREDEKSTPVVGNG